MNKNVSIIVPGSAADDYDDLKELTVTPQTTVRQALEAANLAGYHLRTEGNQFLTESDNLYQRVAAGEKLFAIMRMEVG